MASRLVEIFDDAKLVAKIQNKLPSLFHLAQLESSRGGRVNMAVGAAREQILIALLMYKFGEENVDTRVPANQAEVDARLFGEPISIKSITGAGGVKVVWTVDWQRVEEFCRSYEPRCVTLLAQIQWEGEGGLYLIPVEVQQQIFLALGRDGYLRRPGLGTNPRGVEISHQALRNMIADIGTYKIPIHWSRPRQPFEPYRRWFDHWER